MVSKKDKQTLAHLRQNSRVKLSKLSKATKVPVSTLFDRIKKQEESSVKKFTVLIDYRKIGYLARAYLTIKVRKKSKEDLRQHLCNHKNVNSIYQTNNGYDYLTDVVCKDYLELEEFIGSLEEEYSAKIGSVHHVIDNVREEQFLSEPNLVEAY